MDVGCGQLWRAAVVLWVTGSSGCGPGAHESLPVRSDLTNPPPTFAPLKDIRINKDHSTDQVVCVVDAIGAVACWGDPRLTSPLPGGFERVFPGHEVACALDASGSASCWGNGGGETVRPPSPLRSIGLLYPRMGAGLTPDGEVVTWGDWKYATPPAPGVYRDLSGSFALDASGAIRKNGELIHEDPDYVQIADDGNDAVCGLLRSGAVRCHDTKTEPRQYVLDLSRPEGDFTAIDVAADGGNFACGLTREATIQCWGALTDRQQQVDFAPFDIVAPDGAFVSVATGVELVCGITTGGELRCGGAVWWD